MNRLLITGLMLILVAGCGNKTEENDDLGTNFFPAVSFLNSQVTHVDTSLYRIIRIETAEGKTDTTFIRREDFRAAASDFLELPDITSRKLRDDYEEAEIYDEVLQSFILTYKAKDPDNELLRQDIILDQTNTAGENQVNALVFHTLDNNKKTSVEKNLVWYANKKFVVVTKTNRQNQPEKVHKVEVIWNDQAQGGPM